MFTQPIAMRCTEKQFYDIKEELTELGYKIEGFNNFLQCNYLATRYNGKNDEVKNTMFKEDYNRIAFETWNKDLFLALAAMTDQVNGIKGEWWKCIRSDSSNQQFISGNLYKAVKSLNYSFALIDEQGVNNGLIRNRFTKPTAQEIINHFTKETTTMSYFKITVEQFKQLHSIACQDWKNKLQEWVKETDMFTTHVTLTDSQVKEIFKAATTTQLPVVKEVFPEFGIEAKNYKDVATKLFMSKEAYRLSSSGGVDLVSCVNCPDWLNLSTSKEQLESLLALNQLANVAKYLNEGWKFDWKDTKTKFKICITSDSISIDSNKRSNNGVIYFKTEELAKKAIEILGEETIHKALSIGCH